MTSLQEYDLEIVLAQIVRDQGLCKLVVDSVEIPKNQLTTPIENMHNETQIYCVQNKPNSWYNDVIFYLLHENIARNIDLKNRRALRLRSVSFQLINDILF